jgi:hypothetical protein
MVDPDLIRTGGSEQKFLYTGSIDRIIVYDRNSYKRQSVYLPSVHMVTKTDVRVYL